MSDPRECFTCFPPRCPSKCMYLFAPPVYRLLPPPPKRSNHHLSVLTIVAIVVSSFFLLLCFFRALSRSRRSARNTSFARAIPRPNSSNEGAAPDSGLDQRVINSIVVFNYKKGDGLVQVTECLVCLNEFREQETLRLLPNCTHAFHPECIDTWLESHVNCPLCRAGIVEDEPPPQSSSIGSNRGYSDSAGRNRTENLERSAEVRANRRVEAANDRSSASADSGVSNGGNGAARTQGAREMHPPESNRGFPAQLDRGDNRRSGECVITMMDDTTTPRARISFLIEQSPSSTMHNSLDNRLCRDPGGSSTAASSLLSAGDKKSEQHLHNQNRCRMMGNCSKRSSLHTRPVLMKRSSSNGRMVGSPRHGRRDNHRRFL